MISNFDPNLSFFGSTHFSKVLMSCYPHLKSQPSKFRVSRELSKVSFKSSTRVVQSINAGLSEKFGSFARKLQFNSLCYAFLSKTMVFVRGYLYPILFQIPKCCLNVEDMYGGYHEKPQPGIMYPN